VQPRHCSDIASERVRACHASLDLDLHAMLSSRRLHSLSNSTTARLPHPPPRLQALFSTFFFAGSRLCARTRSHIKHAVGSTEIHLRSAPFRGDLAVSFVHFNAYGATPHLLCRQKRAPTPGKRVQNRCRSVTNSNAQNMPQEFNGLLRHVLPFVSANRRDANNGTRRFVGACLKRAVCCPC
jgi:hypothetical protein